MVVSSVAGFAPPSGEFATLYGPVKTFMNRFVEALNVAYNKHNIYATALCQVLLSLNFIALVAHKKEWIKCQNL